jgi:hypothetical protein
MRGSPPRRRAVAAVIPWAVEVVAHYERVNGMLDQREQ